MDHPAPVPSLWRRVSDAVSRYLAPVPELAIAVGSGGTLRASPAYSTRTSMSALAGHPWVWTAVQAVATDLSGVPLVVIEGRQQTSDHPVLTLLERPNPQCPGVLLRKQLLVDLLLTRNAYIRILDRDAQGNATLIGRLHPAHVKGEVDPASGMVDGWVIGESVAVPYEEILHIRDVSWSDYVDGIYGTSAVQPLDLGIHVDIDTRKQAGRAARRGRLEFIVSPSTPEAVLSTPGAKKVADKLSLSMERGDGVVVLNKSVEVEPISMSRDLEFDSLHQHTRDEILAVFNVPPVRAQQPTANYGTAKQQMRMYWESLRHWGQLLDDAFSQLAPAGVKVRHDFSSVESLQISATERLDRAIKWVTSMQVKPADAARYEGFLDAPVPESAQAPTESATQRPSATEVDEPQAAGLVGALQRYLEHAQRRLLRDGLSPESAEAIEVAILRATVADDDNVERIAALLVDAVHAARAEGADPTTLRVWQPGAARMLAALLPEEAAA